MNNILFYVNIHFGEILSYTIKQASYFNQAKYLQKYIFTLGPYFVRNKYVPHTNNSHRHRGPTEHPRGVPHTVGTSEIALATNCITIHAYTKTELGY
jgi:hypothetical protein